MSPATGRRDGTYAQGTKPEGGDGGAPKAPGKAGGDVPPAVAAAAAGEEVVISAPVHCVGCARKLRRSLQRLDGNTSFSWGKK